jgi:hypothetical protein
MYYSVRNTPMKSANHETIKQLTEYFEGKSIEFELSLDAERQHKTLFT